VAIRRVRIYGDPALRQKAAPVTEFGADLETLVRDLFETMSAYGGVGLAATQVGILQRVLVVDVPLDDNHHARFALVNPSIVERSGSEAAEEGCLSIPGVYDEIPRALTLKVQAVDEDGKPVEIEAEGYLARALQHEMDHLDGVLFIDRLSPLKRQFLKGTLESLTRGQVPDGYHPMEAL
jgi:peptide deformylase